MAAGQQTLSVGINADASGLIKATSQASKSLEGLRKDVQAVDSEAIDVKVDANADAAVKELNHLKKTAGTLDSEAIEISAGLEMTNINRDIANLNKVLAGIEKKKAEPDVGFDLVQLNRDEAKVKKAISDLDKRKATITAGFDVDTSGLRDAAGAVSQLGAGGGGLANLVGFLGKGRALWAGAIGGAALTAYQFVQLSADAETARANLDTLTGSVQAGGQLFDELNRFAAATPFEFDEITAAAGRLLGAGVQIGDIPKTLTAIGDAAAANSQPLDEIAGIYAQMWGKGKVSNEEMLQLQERNIDVYGALAKSMGLTVAQVQEMASENKLGIDAVKKLREELEKAYGGAMARKAETLNGKLSTMNDNISQAGKDIGDIFAPAVEAGVDALTKFAGAIDGVLDRRTELQEAAEAPDASGWEKVFGVFTQSLPEMVGFFKGKTFDVWTGKTNEAADGAERNAAAITKAKEEQKQAAEAAAVHAQQLEAAAKAAKDAEEALGKAADAYALIGDDTRTTVSFVFEKVDAQAEIDKLFAGKHPVQLPADLDFGDLATLGGRQQELVSNVAGMVESGLSEGARRAKTAATLGVTFDEDAWYRQVRATAKKTLIRAGIDPSEIERVLTNVLGLPRPVQVTAEVEGLDAAGQKLDDLTHPRAVPITPRAVDVGPVRTRFDDLVEPRTAPITAKAVDVGKTDDTLDAVAHDRYAHIKLVLDPSLYTHMDDRLDRLARTRTVTVGGATGAAAAGLFSVAGAGTPSLLSAATVMGSQPPGLQIMGGGRPSSSKGVPVQRAINHLAPKQTPVNVYLDGAQIADHVSLRTDRMAAASSSVNRTA